MSVCPRANLCVQNGYYDILAVHRARVPVVKFMDGGPADINVSVSLPFNRRYVHDIVHLSRLCTSWNVQLSGCR
eukprot:24312-Eustigmatos_ZCMA.PRE.1